MNRKRILLVITLASLAVAFFWFGGSQYLSLESLKTQRQAIADYQLAQPIVTAGLFFLFYVAVTALSLPGAAIMTLAAGAIFGFAAGTLLVSFASTTGATLAFLVSRYLFHDWVQQRFGKQLAPVNQGFIREGNFYLFSLRLVPLFPFFVINLLMGITPIKTWPFYWVSQVGMLAGTMVYVNAGTQLGRLQSLDGILSPQLILSFCLLGLFPLASKKLLEYFRPSPATHEVQTQTGDKP